jgi:CRISPR-associated protein Cmr6
MLEKKVPTAKVDKGGWVKQICALNDKQQAQSGRLKGNAEKIRDMVERAEVPGLCFDLTLTTRLVIGMGVPHPIENGTNFHPTLGVPYVPGSALKGATQAFADEWLRNGDYDGVERAEFNTVMRRVFGQPERLKSSASHAEGKTSVGSVAFLDAVPCEPLKLIPEIMTSHMGTYLDAPEGFNLESAEPKPICFLAVEKGTKFRFSIMPTRSSVLNYGIDEAKSDLHIAGGWLVACLRDIGIGAKTKSGYGRFDVAPT